MTTTYRISSNGDSVTFDPGAGGRISSMKLGARERLVTAPLADSPDPRFFWGCYLMAPWVGRLSEGRISWAGMSQQIPTNFGRHAIHGVGLTSRWVVTDHTSTSIALEAEIPTDLWPFAGRLRERASIGPGYLELEASVEAREPMPAAVGWHPWFAATGEDDVRIRLDAGHVLVLDPELIPTGSSEPVTARTDLRRWTEARDRALDDVYVDVVEPAQVRWPDLALEISNEPRSRRYVIHSRAGAVCVEPLTAVPDAIRLQHLGIETGLVELDAGQSLELMTRWTWTTP